MANLASSTALSSTPAEQAITASLCVEIMHDLDDGRPTLIASTDAHLSDLAEVGPSEAMRKVREARAELDRAEELINEYTATVTLPAFIEHYGIRLIETDLEGLAAASPKIAAAFKSFALAAKDRTLTVLVPEHQAPVERLAVIRDLVLDLQRRADTA
jgi:hypothetical protein